MDHKTRRPRQSGFTLVEILVGVAIGVTGLLVIFQTLAVWNRHTQASTSGGDADVAGTLAVFNVDRDLRLGGMGIGTAGSTLMGCPVTLTNVAASYTRTFAMTPVLISAGTASEAPGSDVVDVLYGNSSFFTAGERVISSTGISNFLARRNGFKQGDMAIIGGTAASGVPACALVEVTDTGNADGFTIGHSPNVSYTSYYTSAAASAVFNPTTAYPTVTGATIFSLGPFPRLNHWAVSASNVLQRTDLIHNSPAVDIAEGVINLKAQYGVDANSNGRIESTEWTTTAPTNWDSVLAVRMAFLVRSSQYERSPDRGDGGAVGPVTTAAPVWSGGTFVMTNVDGTTDNNQPGDVNNWRQYRYRVFERVVPLRNMIWG